MDNKQPTQPSIQKTEKGLEIPIPKKRDVFGDLAKTAKPQKARKVRNVRKNQPRQ